MLKDDIMEVTHGVAMQIIESGESDGKYRPLGKFYEKDKEAYIGLDNSHGNCWVEEFNTKKACFKWLKGY